MIKLKYLVVCPGKLYKLVLVYNLNSQVNSFEFITLNKLHGEGTHIDSHGHCDY